MRTRELGSSVVQVILLVVVAALAAVTPSVLAAQEIAPTASPGSDVRVTIPPQLRFSGNLAVVWTDSISLNTSKGRFSLPLDQITRVEVPRRRSRGAGAVRGLAWGALLGAAGGAVFGLIDGGNCEGGAFSYCYDETEGAMIGAVVFGVLGGGIGSLVGALAPGDRWVTAALGPADGRAASSPQTSGPRR